MMSGVSGLRHTFPQPGVYPEPALLPFLASVSPIVECICLPGQSLTMKSLYVRFAESETRIGMQCASTSWISRLYITRNATYQMLLLPANSSWTACQCSLRWNSLRCFCSTAPAQSRSSGRHEEWYIALKRSVSVVAPC